MAEYKPECLYFAIKPDSYHVLLDPVSNMVHSVDLHDTQRHTILPHQTKHSHDS